MSIPLQILLLTALFFAAQSPAIDDSFSVEASPAEVRTAMNQLGGAALMAVPGPHCIKSVLVQGGVDTAGGIYYTAGGGLLGTATGQLHDNGDGTTRVEITAEVISDTLHRTVMGSPEALAEKITRQIAANRRQRR